MYLLMTQLLGNLMEWVEQQIRIVKYDISALMKALVLLLLSLVLATIGIGFLLAGVFLILKPYIGAAAAAFVIAAFILGVAIVVGIIAKGKTSS